MRTSGWARAAEIFDQLVELDPGDRASQLSLLCAGDEELTLSVVRLLALHDDQQSGDRMESDIHDVIAAATPVVGARPGDRIGPFHIVRSLGEGGMGEVYLAERRIDEGTQRVALKIPQQRPDRVFVERFHRERGILAGLSHPSIARLLDSGTLEDGRPYFAMEYVDGIPLFDYCDSHRLSLIQRIGLFVRLLPAVQHAHEHFVLHRDIKSGNVLVAADGLPRLLDFGIAKSVDAMVESGATAEGGNFFSLATAAPEQVSGAATGIATDTYALGAMLYELACGLPPLELRGMAPAQALHAITEQPPLPPSDAVLALGARDPALAASLAARRALGSASALARRLHGDLELILRRALHKSPRLRYPTAEAFARDLDALLQLRPISQRDHDHVYRIGRFLRRHRVAAVGVAAAAVLSVGYLGLSWHQARMIALERDRAEAGRVQAEAVTRFLVGLFRNADPTVARGNNPDAQELLERGKQSLASELKGQPALRATLLLTLAEIYFSLNDFEATLQHAEQARTDIELLPTVDVPLENRITELLVRAKLAEANYAGALTTLDAALQQRTLSDASPDADVVLFGLRAMALAGNANLDEALELFPVVDAAMQRRFGTNDTRTRSLMRRWSLALQGSGRIEQARALASQAAQGDVEPGSTDDPETAQLAYRQAIVLRDQGRLVDAERMAEEALRINRRVYGEIHTATAASLNVLASIASARDDNDRALNYFSQVLDTTTQLYPPDHPRLAMAQYNLGLTHLLFRNDAATALPHLQRAVDIAGNATGPDHPNLAIFRLALGQALGDLGRRDEARAILQAALDQFVEIAAPRGRNEASASGELACLVLSDATGGSSARERLANAIAVLEAQLPPGHPRLARLHACQANAE